MSILRKIVKNKKAEVKAMKEKMPVEALLNEIMKLPANRNFRDVFEYNDFSVIAEIKKKAPSRGTIKASVNAGKLAAAYEKAGAKAISVVTDRKFFDGKLDFIRDVKKETNLPVLRKDFVIDEYQIYESRVGRADALLLIASILDKKQLNAFVKKTRSLNMTPVVEVHTPDEVKKAVASGTDVIGINTRDLKTFRINFGKVKSLIKGIPRDKFVICESGFASPEDISNIPYDEKIKAVLIGTMLMSTPEKQLKDSINKVLRGYGRD